MNFKILFLLLSTFNFSCQEKVNPSSEMVKTTKVKTYTTEINYIKQYAKQKEYNQDIAFMIDYSLHSGYQRFFVVNLKQGEIIKKGLVCHGGAKGKNNSGIPKVFSNASDSHCTTLGMAIVAERAYSNWGKHYKYWLDGLENKNSNLRKRVVVLHAWEGVDNKDIYPNVLAVSWGCPTVSVQFLDELDAILKKHDKVLLYSF